jgi:hypothetical protein
VENIRRSKVDDVLFFVQASFITEKSKARIDAYVQLGFHLGSHSHSHFSVHKKNVEA